MHFVLIYDSIEGQTRKISKHIEALLKSNHHSCVTILATDEDAIFDPVDAIGIIVCAPVHTGTFPKSVYRLLKRQHSELMAHPGAFISVSLAAASGDKSEVKEIDKIVHALSEDTGWWPVATHNAAGALKYIEYDFFKKWIMKRISKKSDGPTDTSQDYEFTNWDALDKFVLQFVGDIPALKNKI